MGRHGKRLVGDRVVVKFGGADLATGERLRRAARMVVGSGYREIVAVVSAIGRTTDRLVEVLGAPDKFVDDGDYADILSMGERTSARMFASSLKSLGAAPVLFEPTQPNWPIVTDNNYLDACVDMKRTTRAVRRWVEPVLGKGIPVVCGFVGRSHEGRVTTLGRGGSDITALVLANCLCAREVILVKETRGIMSGDPKVVRNARPLERLDIHEMFALAGGGAKVIRANALAYKLERQILRVVSFDSRNISRGGTRIEGHFDAEGAEVVSRGRLSALTAVGRVDTQSLSKLFLKLRGMGLYGTSTGQCSVTVFIDSRCEKRALREIHATKCFDAVTSRSGVGMMEITDPDFVDSPGGVARVAGVLSSRRINIIEITTSKATINVFVDEKKLGDAYRTVCEFMKT